jgi:glycine/D-amino acid oxidase-like deaminating enzyme
VHGWRAEAAGVIVSTDRGDIAADRLVLTPGPWAAELLQVPAVSLTVLRKSLFWYRPSASVSPSFAAGSMPCFAFDAPAGFFYGFPSLDHRGVKIAEHSGGHVVTDPLSVDRGIEATEQQAIEKIIATHLPTLGTARADHAVCLYTMSPDHHFVVGLHPEHDRVAIAAGFSGHGFKFASVMGSALADLANTGSTSLPIGFLSPRRFC